MNYQGPKKHRGKKCNGSKTLPLCKINTNLDFSYIVLASNSECRSTSSSCLINVHLSILIKVIKTQLYFTGNRYPVVQAPIQPKKWISILVCVWNQGKRKFGWTIYFSSIISSVSHATAISPYSYILFQLLVIKVIPLSQEFFGLCQFCITLCTRNSERKTLFSLGFVYKTDSNSVIEKSMNHSPQAQDWIKNIIVYLFAVFGAAGHVFPNFLPT